MACCDINRGIDRTDTCGTGLATGLNDNVIIQSKCNWVATTTENCTAAVSEYRVTALTPDGNNAPFVELQAQPDGVTISIASERQDSGRYDGTNTISVNVYGYSEAVACFLNSVAGNEVLIGVVQKDGTELIFGVNDSVYFQTFEYTNGSDETTATITFTSSKAIYPHVWTGATSLLDLV